MPGRGWRLDGAAAGRSAAGGGQLRRGPRSALAGPGGRGVGGSRGGHGTADGRAAGPAGRPGARHRVAPSPPVADRRPDHRPRRRRAPPAVPVREASRRSPAPAVRVDVDPADCRSRGHALPAPHPVLTRPRRSRHGAACRKPAGTGRPLARPGLRLGRAYGGGGAPGPHADRRRLELRRRGNHRPYAESQWTRGGCTAGGRRADRRAAL